MASAAAGAEASCQYVPYAPSVSEGAAHPDLVVETAALAAVKLPKLKDKSHKLGDAVLSKALSNVQLEAVLYARQRFEGPRLDNEPDGERAGFLLGDGAGVGKGRTIAGLLLEYVRRGLTRCLWLSTSQELMVDAKRDLSELGVPETNDETGTVMFYPSINGAVLPKGDLDEKGITGGVLFATYTLLCQGHTKRDREDEEEGLADVDVESFNYESMVQKEGSRLHQLVTWLKRERDEAPLIIFDECHRAKNLVPPEKKSHELTDEDTMYRKNKGPTLTALSVMALQKAIPKARILYVSATGASEARHLSYMVRLGTFGFPSLNQLTEKMEGLSACEVVSLGLKATGCYLCRTLSYEGAEFVLDHLEPGDELRLMYDRACDLWVLLLRVYMLIKKTLKRFDASLKRSQGLSMYWGAHQRFFRQLLVSAKVPEVSRRAVEAEKKGMSVVIALQATGEAAARQAGAEDDAALDDFTSTPTMIIRKLIQDHFPIDVLVKKPDGTPMPMAVNHDFEEVHTMLLQAVQAWRDAPSVRERAKELMEQRRANQSAGGAAADAGVSAGAGAGGSAAGAAAPAPGAGASAVAGEAAAANDDDDGDDDIALVRELNFEEQQQERLARAKRNGAYFVIDDGENAAGAGAGAGASTAAPPPNGPSMTVRILETEVANARSTFRSSGGVQARHAEAAARDAQERADVAAAGGDSNAAAAAHAVAVKKEKAAAEAAAAAVHDDDSGSDDELLLDPMAAAKAYHAHAANGTAAPNTSAAGASTASAPGESLPPAKKPPAKKPPAKKVKAEKKTTHPSSEAPDSEDEDSGEDEWKVNKALEKCKKLILDLLDDGILELPPNPLDHLIDMLGGPQCVAEMTGRTKQFVRLDDGSLQYVRRRADVKGKEVNLHERDDFCSGKKRYAIISEAASTGISLHADRRFGSANRRRFHMTIELPWSSDRTIQSMGRSHRSNQQSAPIYSFVVTSCAGETRFASSASSRLQNLGAILRGDRNATGAGSALQSFDVDNEFGKAALLQILQEVFLMHKDALGNYKPEPTVGGIEQPLLDDGGDYLKHAKELLESIGFAPNSDEVHTENGHAVRFQHEFTANVKVSRFLNRLLGLCMSDQRILFDHFSATFDHLVSEAKANGHYNDGFSSDSWGSTASEHTKLIDQGILHTDEASGAVTRWVKLETDEGVTWQAAQDLLKGHISKMTERLEQAKAAVLALVAEKAELESGAVDLCMGGRYTTVLALLKKRRAEVFNIEKKVLRESGFYIRRARSNSKHGKHRLVILALEEPADGKNRDSFTTVLIHRPNAFRASYWFHRKLKSTNIGYTRVTSSDPGLWHEVRKEWDY